ncbi:MAG: ABC transporter permease [Desulfobacteraceae bacterium]|nr:ABC transporter permease [Desulfobacteraceae bacterium]
MLKYLVNRILFMVLTIYVLATLMFFMFRLLPGDPTMTVISSAMSPKAQEAMKRQYGLDKPLYRQYTAYLNNIVHLDFGYSFQHSRRVSQMIAGRMLNTLLLILPSMIAAYALGVIMGAFIAYKRGGRTEISSVILATAFQSAPVFWIGMLCIFIFSVHLDIFPLGHILSPGMHYGKSALAKYLSLDFFHHFALPFTVITAYNICFPMLLMRSSMLETFGEDFIELCKMKGMGEKRIIYKHAMRNSFLPIATTLPLILGWAVAGSVVIETVFSWPGLGLLMVEAVQCSDYPVVQACFLMIAVLTIVGNFVADLLYGILDPRIVYK